MVTAPLFDWDAGNREKCTKHGVADSADRRSRSGTFTVRTEVRAIGRTLGGRHVFVVFTLRRRGGTERIRPISARYMHRKEVSVYEKANPILKENPDLQDR